MESRNCEKKIFRVLILRVDEFAVVIHKMFSLVSNIEKKLSRMEKRILLILGRSYVFLSLLNLNLLRSCSILLAAPDELMSGMAHS